MLGFINKLYFLMGLFLYFGLISKVDSEYMLLYSFAIFSFFCYFGVLYINSNMDPKYYNTTFLTIETFIYIAIFVVLQNYLSYVYTGNFFVFSVSDAYFYHTQAAALVQMPLKDAIHHYLQIMSFDDLGIILVLYPLYKIAPSNLMLNFVYIFAGTITALAIFDIAKNFISRKYAFMASIAYSLSSFVLFYHSSGLKESFMIMLVVLAVDFYYKFANEGKVSYAIYSLLFLASLFLFRPAISAMIVAGIIFSSLFSKEGSSVVKIISFVLLLVMIAMKNFLASKMAEYTAGGVDSLISARESQGAIIGSLPFTYVANILSQAIGPLPTMVASETKILTTLYSPGLLYKTLISVPFWWGVYYAFVGKRSQIYPIILFTIFEMASLVFLLDGFELRKAMPHIPFVYIIAFWFLDKYDNRIIRIKKPQLFRYTFYVMIAFLSLLIIYWNFR